MKPDWKQILKILIAVLTAIAGTLGVASCVRSGLSPSLSQGEGATIIAANINLSEYENISHSRDV